jgi:hypothetical protein
MNSSEKPSDPSPVQETTIKALVAKQAFALGQDLSSSGLLHQGTLTEIKITSQFTPLPPELEELQIAIIEGLTIRLREDQVALKKRASETDWDNALKNL